MSRYTFLGGDERYSISIGVDPRLSTVFAQVDDLVWETRLIDEHIEIGDIAEEGLLI